MIRQVVEYDGARAHDGVRAQDTALTTVAPTASAVVDPMCTCPPVTAPGPRLANEPTVQSWSSDAFVPSSTPVPSRQSLLTTAPAKTMVPAPMVARAEIVADG